jgi:colanic acid/amylovoran biosynthesis glycosyltransferase
VRPGEAGWLFPAGDVDALAAVLEQLLATPIAQLESMGKAGYERVLGRHSADVEAEKLARLFRAQQAAAPAMAPVPATLSIVSDQME